MANRKTDRVTLRLTSKLRTSLEQLSSEQDVSISKLIHNILERTLREEGHNV